MAFRDPVRPSLVTADGSLIVVTGAPAAGQLVTADGPNAAHWQAPAVPAVVPPIIGITTATAGLGAAAPTTTFGAFVKTGEAFHRDDTFWLLGSVQRMSLSPGIYSADLSIDVTWTADPGLITANFQLGYSATPPVLQTAAPVTFRLKTRISLTPTELGWGMTELWAYLAWANVAVTMTAASVRVDVVKWAGDVPFGA